MILYMMCGKPVTLTAWRCVSPGRTAQHEFHDCLTRGIREILISIAFLITATNILSNAQVSELPQFCPHLPTLYQVFCGNPSNPSDCIVEYWLCDGVPDCTSGFDETEATCFHGDPCHGHACENGGACIGFPAEEHKTVAYYLCDCLPGFTGPRCETNLGGPVVSTPGQPETTTRQITQPSSSSSPPITSTSATFSSSTPSITTQSATTTVFFPSTSQGPSTTTTTTASPSSLTTPSTTQQISTTTPFPPTPLLVCETNPCLNGVCTPLREGYHCSCRPGYAGQQCEFGINFCASEPCFNGGICQRIGEGFSCLCAIGYQSRQCEVETNECLSGPCRNGATCRDLVGGFVCDCLAGFSGPRCEFNVNECLSFPCYLSEGGRCVDKVNSFTCECPLSRAGQFCERPKLCRTDPCQNYGVCFPSTFPARQPSCQCLPGFTGVHCETNIFDCIGDPCGPHGTCMDGVQTFTCECATGFTGPRCEVELDPCAPNPCYNLGYCCRSGKTWCAGRLPPGYFECYCTDGYTGELCASRSDPCTPDPCQNSGLCNHVGEGYQCTCPLTFTGTNCETAVPCSSQPCLNNGECRHLGSGSYQCVCGPEHYGQFCEKVIPCLNQPCLNGGRCVNQDNGFLCECLGSFTGFTCETFLPCAGQPCLNAGACVPSGGQGFTCQCQVSFTGQFCEQFLPCAGNPCGFGGSCVDTLTGSYACLCQGNYTGSNCETFMTCSSGPCHNGATCVENEDQSGFRCQCTERYRGPYCDIYLPCSTTPCLNEGICSDNGDGTFRCICRLTHTGSRCETLLPCAAEPCLNNGACTNDVTTGRYSCECTPSYSGPTCEFFRKCISQPCQHGGTCVDLDGGLIDCQCTDGYLGPACETPLECVPNPCYNGGRCGLQFGAIVCQCEAPYTGRLCESRDECLTRPCLNGGYCLSVDDAPYRCLCPSAYTGQRCETFMSCSSFPCLNGRCVEAGSSYSCECFPMYAGRNCEVYTACGSGPCQNAASCIDQGFTYLCECLPNFDGLDCQRALPCASNPCVVGTCVNTGDTYRCECDPRYTGARCDAPLVCDVTTCVNGQCLEVGGLFSCVCLPDYTGSDCGQHLSPCVNDPCPPQCACRDMSPGFLCECTANPTTSTLSPTPINSTLSPTNSTLSPTNSTLSPTNPTLSPTTSTLSPTVSAPTTAPCDSQPCQNAGDCVNVLDSFICQCPMPFSGPRCEYRENICDSNPCRNGGHCLEDGVTFSCACQPPSTGRTCEAEVTSCDGDPCQGRGTCYVDFLGVFCHCTDGYEGLFCQLVKGACDPNPCSNKGECWQVNGTTACDCPKGFNGPFCLDPVTRCAPNICNEGGCVENNKGVYMCSCPPDWIGEECHVRNPCYSQPCGQGGTCIAMVSGYVCVCPAGLTGLECEQLLPACSSNPCFNGGSCQDGGSQTNFVCGCLLGFTGLQCEANVDDCVGDGLKCANGGTCVDLVNDFRCDCSLGYSGPRCTIRDTCANRPCGDVGTCLGQPSPQYGVDYTCLCPPLYEGPTCGQFRFCSSGPCLNGGTCGNLPQGFRCTCPADLTGSRCEQQVFGCQGVTCGGHGQCFAVGQTGHECYCDPGYQGNDCELSTCDSLACEHGGSCLPGGPNGFLCRCSAGWAGDRCEIDSQELWPAFGDQSYLTLPASAALSSTTWVEVTLRPAAGDGLVLYAAQLDSPVGDYMALSLEQQAPVFRINLGSGPLTLRGPPLSLNTWYTISVSRLDQSTTLTVGDFTVHANTPGSNSGLTLGSVIWVGGVPQSVTLYQDVGVQDGFTGCIHLIKIGRHRAAVVPWGRATETQGVRQCVSDPCAAQACRNGAECQLHGQVEMSCRCLVGFTGEYCETGIPSPTIPAFDGSGHLLSRSLFTAGDQLTVTMEIRPSADEGLLLYNNGGVGDYFAAFMSEGFLHFTFDLGSGSVTLATTSALGLNTWHWVQMSRTQRNGSLLMDNEAVVTGLSQGPNTNMDVGEVTYVGGVALTVDLPVFTGGMSGFRGCIRGLTIQGNEIDVTALSEGYDVRDCVIPPCENNLCAAGATCRTDSALPKGYACICPFGMAGELCELGACDALPESGRCQNGGTCMLDADGRAMCICTHLYSGSTCQRDLQISVVQFRPHSFLAYPQRRFIGTNYMALQLVLRTTASYGQLLFTGNSTHNVSIQLVAGSIEVQVDFGRGRRVLSSSFTKANTDSWILLQLLISGSNMSLQMTGQEGKRDSYTGNFPGSLFSPSDVDVVFLGSLPLVVTPGTVMATGIGFMGCIVQLRAAAQPMAFTDVAIQGDAIDGMGIDTCAAG